MHSCKSFAESCNVISKLPVHIHPYIHMAEQNGGNLEEPCSVARWDSEDQGIVGKETAEGSPPVSERDGELTDGMGQEGQEDGEGKAGVKMEGKGESYVLSLKVVLPGSSEPLTVMVSSILGSAQHGKWGTSMEGGAVLGAGWHASSPAPVAFGDVCSTSC